MVSDAWAGNKIEGYHNDFILNGCDVFYAVIYDISPTQISLVQSHEAGGLVTDPLPGTGYYDNTIGPVYGEITDIYLSQYTFRIDGFPMSRASGPNGEFVPDLSYPSIIFQPSTPLAPSQPSAFPMNVLVQMTIDVLSMPDWSNAQAMAMLENMFWVSYWITLAQPPQLASDLMWQELGLTWDLLLVNNNPLLLVSNPHTISSAHAIHENPLYYTLAGWLMANSEMERLLIG